MASQARFISVIVITLFWVGNKAENIIDIQETDPRVVNSICPELPCSELSPEDLIFSLWSLPTKVSPLVAYYRDAIINLIEFSTKEEIALLLSQSLWAVDQFTGFNPAVDPACVYGALINQTLRTLKYGTNICKICMNEAIKNYGELCNSAINFSVYVGLSGAGCPAINPYNNITQSSESCYIGKNLKRLLYSCDSIIPWSLKSIIFRLSKSPNPRDRAVALGAVASATETGINLFNQLLKGNELIKVIQLKSCNLRIPNECCDAREEDLKASTAALLNATISSIASITKT